MTREETKKLIRIIVSTYPNWKPENISDTIDAWTWALEDYPFDAISAAYKIYVRSDRSGFAPSVNQLITNIQKGNEMNMLSEGEAWALVKRAIQDGNYHAQERYDELPEMVQKAVGSPNMIRQWAMTDTAEVNTVIASNFQRTYKTICKREIEKKSISPELLDLTKMLADKLSGRTQNVLTVNEDYDDPDNFDDDEDDDYE